MTSWLDELIEGTVESETPERYFWWAGLAAISATVRKNVYLERYFYKLYPNIFVALVSARSGLRKGVAVSTAKSILEEADEIRVISGCNSIQGLIHELSMQKTFENGRVISEAQGILLSDEFESFLTEDPRALTYLTALHNTHEHEKQWTKTLKSSPTETLKSPCLTLLVASNEVLFDSIVKAKDIEGGFIARTFIVHESKRKLLNDLTIEPKKRIDKKALAERLKDISKIKGEFIFDPMARLLYADWYKKISSLNIDDRTGSLERLGDQGLKVAMLVSLARKPELILTEEDINEATMRCEACMPAVKVVGLSGQGETSEAIAKVLKVLIEAPNRVLERKRILLKLHSRGVDALVLDRVIESLTQAGAIRAFRENKQIHYEMTEEMYHRYVKFKNEEN